MLTCCSAFRSEACRRLYRCLPSSCALLTPRGCMGCCGLGLALAPLPASRGGLLLGASLCGTRATFTVRLRWLGAGTAWPCGRRASAALRTGGATCVRTCWHHRASFQQDLHNVSRVQRGTPSQRPLLLPLFVFELRLHAFGFCFQGALPVAKLLERVRLEIGPSCEDVGSSGAAGGHTVLGAGGLASAAVCRRRHARGMRTSHEDAAVVEAGALGVPPARASATVSCKRMGAAAPAGGRLSLVCCAAAVTLHRTAVMSTELVTGTPAGSILDASSTDGHRAGAGKSVSVSKRRTTKVENPFWKSVHPVRAKASVQSLFCTTATMAVAMAAIHALDDTLSAGLLHLSAAYSSRSLCLNATNTCVSHGCSSHVSFAGNYTRNNP